MNQRKLETLIRWTPWAYLVAKAIILLIFY